MQDVQNRTDHRGLALDQVGVQSIRCPIIVMDRAAERQHTIATLRMSVSLPHHFKGTHMSRFIEVLQEHRGEITMRTLPTEAPEPAASARAMGTVSSAASVDTERAVQTVSKARCFMRFPFMSG